MLIAGLWIYQPLNVPTGQLHPEYSTMLRSGESVAADPLVKWMAYLFGLGIISIFALALLIGARKEDPGKQRGLSRALGWGLGAYFIVYTLFVIVYWQYAGEATTGFALGFPIPTAMMLYALGFVPLVMTFVYLVKFRDWVLTEEEEERFKEIMANKDR